METTRISRGRASSEPLPFEIRDCDDRLLGVVNQKGADYGISVGATVVYKGEVGSGPLKHRQADCIYEAEVDGEFVGFATGAGKEASEFHGYTRLMVKDTTLRKKCFGTWGYRALKVGKRPAGRIMADPTKPFVGNRTAADADEHAVYETAIPSMSSRTSNLYVTAVDTNLRLRRTTDPKSGETVLRPQEAVNLARDILKFYGVSA